ncbi:MAG: hypothetical protein IJM51_11805 [Clostridia bacterium]|nr:hypothetical protein [Clostridia bacterium]
MSAGIIWYKTQPDSKKNEAVNDLLTDYCGSILSHDVTVRPERIAPLISSILSRSENVIIIGGIECQNQEENIVFILARVLGIPLEMKYRSRSRYCFDKLRNTRLPSLSGSVLFPARKGYPEGILLTSGKQSIIVLPVNYRLAVSAAVTMREYFIPEVSRRRQRASTETAPEIRQKDYEKFKRSRKTAPQTREYSEYQLIETMERASRRAYEDSPDNTAFDYMYDDQNRGGR